MRTSNMLRMTTLAAAILGFAGAAQAVDGPYFQSRKTGNWTSANVWLQSATLNGTYTPASTCPVAGDFVRIVSPDLVTVNANSAAATLTVDASAELDVSTTYTLTLSGGSSSVTGSLVVPSGATVALAGASPSLTVIGTITLDGLMQLNSSSGVPYFEIQTSQTVPNSTTGRIQGLVAAGGQPEIRINANAAANTMTNAGMIDGDLMIKAINNGSNNANFANHRYVVANVNGEITLDSSLNAISDGNSAYEWRVEGTSVTPSLRFGQGSTGLSGAIKLLVTGGTIAADDSVSTSGTFTYDAGALVVAANQAFCFSNHAGSCFYTPWPSCFGSTSIVTFNPCP